MKALALISGGLDSTLAIKVILDQGIVVEAINFLTPFCQCSRKGGCGHEAKKVAERFGVRLKILNVAGQYIKMVKSPKHGYGRNLNPCIDCRILMLQSTKEYMQETGSSFVITGEVLGQRPMSQHRAALRTIEKESGLEGLILRPLSAKLLPLSIPEKEGWINREKLLEISGRSRKPQMAKAQEYEITDYPCAAGGCLLTDSGFSRRMKDLMDHAEITLNDIELLKVGRHFRLFPSCKVIFGRDKEENEKLSRLIQKDDLCFSPQEIKGPLGVGRGVFDQAAITLAAKIMARYCDNSGKGLVKIKVERYPQVNIKSVTVNGMSETELKAFRI